MELLILLAATLACGAADAQMLDQTVALGVRAWLLARSGSTA